MAQKSTQDEQHVGRKLHRLAQPVILFVDHSAKSHEARQVLLEAGVHQEDIDPQRTCVHPFHEDHFIRRPAVSFDRRLYEGLDEIRSFARLLVQQDQDADQRPRVFDLSGEHVL